MQSSKENIKVTDFTNMSESDAKKEVEMLNTYLATLQVFYANLRGYHWHVQGPLFSILHSRTEELYELTADQADEVAERILMLEGVPVRRFDDVKKLSKIEESGAESLHDGNKISMAILDSFKVLTDLERKGIEAAEKANDPVTADLFTGYLAGREKTAWMITAALK